MLKTPELAMPKKVMLSQFVTKNAQSGQTMKMPRISSLEK